MPASLVVKHTLISASLTEALQRITDLLLGECKVIEQNVTVVLTDDFELQRLNHSFRGQDKPTNVLSFPFNEGLDPAVQSLGFLELGDIVISVDRADHEAQEAGQSLIFRLNWLIIHGLLHLLGYDHERSKTDAELMFERESQLYSAILQNRRRQMTNLAINVDHVATIRQARGGVEPDPVTAAAICEIAGAQGIVVHLREDRRHIQDRDVRLLRETVKTKLNLEMGAAKEIVGIALDLVPDMVTLVPEKRKELTTEGGLDVVSQKKKLAGTISRMTKAGIPVSLFIDPESKQVNASHEIGATFVELHTGRYAEANNEETMHRELELIRSAAEEAHILGLRVNAGHGLNYLNTAAIAALDTVEELSIGHAIIARAAFTGLEQAVKEMRQIIIQANLF